MVYTALAANARAGPGHHLKAWAWRLRSVIPIHVRVYTNAVLNMNSVVQQKGRYTKSVPLIYMSFGTPLRRALCKS